MQKYSDFFKTLHDETEPTGYLGRGTHYSILRAVVWHDQFGKILEEAHYLDFAIVWDEDHDTRIIEVLEAMYLKGLLSPVIIAGERKGGLTLLFSHENRAKYSGIAYQCYVKKAQELAQPDTDWWETTVTTIDDDDNGIINDSRDETELYLNNLCSLWKLGLSKIPPKKTVEAPLFTHLT